MGTRSLLAFRVKRRLIAQYSHWGGSYNEFGIKIIRDFLSMNVEDFIKRVESLRVVSDSTPPTEEDILLYKKWGDISVGEQTLNEWYCLLRKCQSNLLATLESGVIHHYHSHSYPLESESDEVEEDGSGWLNEEYGYLFDIDKQRFYAGTNSKVEFNLSFDELLRLREKIFFS